jgi:tetratricopeptide (TPR) repeat protein
MALPVLLFAAALAVRADHTPLRDGCDTNDPVIAALPAGTPVDIRFRLSDGSDCFKISATLAGKDVSGYVPASALTGLAQFEAAQAASEPVAVSEQAAHELTTRAAQPTSTSASDPAIARAAQFLNANQPSQALDALLPSLQRHPNDANILLLAGLAAYRSDQLHDALDYWKHSLDLSPNPSLLAVYENAKREASADHSGDKLYGSYIALRYEGQALPADTARAIVATLDTDYARISAQLGCRPNERVVAIVQDRDSYLRSTGAAEWSGGQYDGRIHIAWTNGTQLSPEIQRRLAHELVHACLSSIPSGAKPWPAWLQEGLAQKLSGDTLPADTRDRLQKLAAAHLIPPLERLGQDWSAMSTNSAVAAYSLALEAADALYDNYAGSGILNILRNPEQLPAVTSALDTKLGF